MSRTRSSTRGPAVTAPDTSFGFAEYKEIVHDLFKPNVYIYWTDLLISLTIAYGCAATYFALPAFSLLQIVCFIVSGFALHRVEYANMTSALKELFANARQSSSANQLAGG